MLSCEIIVDKAQDGSLHRSNDARSLRLLSSDEERCLSECEGGKVRLCKAQASEKAKIP